MNVGRLKKLLNRLPNDIEIFIDMVEDIGLIPMCGKTGLELMPFTDIESPDIVRGDQILILNPCFCHVDEENQEEEKTLLN